MKHQMGLYEEYFQSVADGTKTVEVRLNDGKRRNVKTGDTIEFTKLPEQDETLQVRVTDLQVFETFSELYRAVPFEDLGGAGWTMEAMLEGTYDIYTPEQEAQWGVLAITIERVEEERR